MKNKNRLKLITFAKRHEFIEPPVPSATALPSWYRAMPKFPKKNDPHFVGVKSCVPFLDSMTSGYFVTTPCDIVVTQTPDGPYLKWKIDWDPVQFREPDSLMGLPIPSGYSREVFAWFFPYVMKANKNVSFLITHPMNRYDLPFLTTSGVVDMNGVLNSGHLPFFIKEGFEGVIEKGTPFAQVLPFVRKNWQMKESASVKKDGDLASFLTNSKLHGYYRDSVWAKKLYKMSNEKE
jgi:hypothetical protein